MYQVGNKQLTVGRLQSGKNVVTEPGRRRKVEVGNAEALFAALGYIVSNQSTLDGDNRALLTSIVSEYC